jgi:hypothetical protein
VEHERVADSLQVVAVSPDMVIAINLTLYRVSVDI